MRRGRVPHRVAVVAAALVAAAGPVACRAGSGDGPGDGPPLRLRVTAEQWRVHEAARELAVALHNDGDVPVRVTRVEPVLPSFEGEEAVSTDALLPVGGLRVDVPVKFGTGGCEAAAAASHVVVEARAEGAARPQRITLPFPHPNPLLDKLLATDCAAQRIRSSVSLRFGPWQDLGPDGVRGSLVVERTAAAGTGTVRVLSLDGNVMYRLTMARTTPLATVDAARPTVSVPFTADPLRCDLHAFAEVKKPFEFPVRVAVDDGEPLADVVPVDDDDRAALDTMLRRICGVPPS